MCHVGLTCPLQGTPGRPAPEVASERLRNTRSGKQNWPGVGQSESRFRAAGPKGGMAGQAPASRPSGGASYRAKIRQLNIALDQGVFARTEVVNCRVGVVAHTMKAFSPFAEKFGLRGRLRR